MAGGLMRDLIALARPRQWIKNGFVLAPLLFSGSFAEPDQVRRALVATLVFCVASAAAYVLNDLLDLEADRLHPIKKARRPLAAGRVSRRQAVWLLWSLWLAVAASAMLTPRPGLVAVAYVALTAAYSLKLKHVPVVDLFVLSAGFVLRVFAGARAIDVVLSPWMLITTLSLALYLAANKRREELTAHGGAGRRVLGTYTPALLARYADWAAVGAMVFYCLFVVTVRPALAASVPLVLFGLFRYAYRVEAAGEGESPTDVVWGDRVLLLTVVAWAALCVAQLRAVQ